MFLDKKAVSVGGGLSHRLNLSDGFLIKDNHLRSIKTKYHLKDKTEAINKFIMINSPFNPDVMIEVEVEEEKEALTLLSTKQKIKSPFNLTVMFDNFTPENAKKTIEKLKKKFDLSNIIIEGSGGINEKNLLNWASTGVDFISIGSLTHSTRALNLSLEF
jgi:nicotinate-nucleotide pyrophosphorylase (carboxylating)